MRAEMSSTDEEIKQLQALMAAEDERALRTKVKLADDQQDLATLKQVRDALEAKIKATEKEIEATYAQFKADEISDKAAKKRAKKNADCGPGGHFPAPRSVFGGACDHEYPHSTGFNSLGRVAGRRPLCLRAGLLDIWTK